jgi:formate/nitrite transporter FocA (FNT family)
MRKRRGYALVLLALALAAMVISGVAEGHAGEVVVGLAVGVVFTAGLIAVILYVARKWEQRRSN